MKAPKPSTVEMRAYVTVVRHLVWKGIQNLVRAATAAVTCH